MGELGVTVSVGSSGWMGSSSARDKRDGREDHQSKEGEDIEPEKVRLSRETLIHDTAILRGDKEYEEPPIILSFLLERIAKDARMHLWVATLQLAGVGQHPHEADNPREHEGGN